MDHSSRNLINLKSVAKHYGAREVLRGVTLGVADGDRIGIVGANGEGKSTLLKLIAGLETEDAGVVTRTAGVSRAILAQGDELDPGHSVEEALAGSRATHEWAGDARFRAVLDGLLGGVDITIFGRGLTTPVAELSGGERRRVALARQLIDNPQLLLLDEPTNHLDIEAINWLAGYLAKHRGALVVITHDRWFLDAVCTQTWEVTAGTVHQYDGGYAAYVLARAERDRQAAAHDARRRQLVRKELAWLRRGPPARTAKPKFRIEAANELIADEPPPRNTVELMRFATSRLGNKVIDAEHVSVAYGDGRTVLNNITWRLGPGDRVALVGMNGSGKTTLVKVLCGQRAPSSGVVERGSTVKIAELSQTTVEVPGHMRVLEALEDVRQSTMTSDGVRVSASQLCERFGFRGARAGTLVRDLSGGERRRLQLMRLLMTEPNVLVLDEPTNDLDIDTLTALEDLLDTWPGTLIVVSHDRYFVERVADNVYALTADGRLRHLPHGIDQYIEQQDVLHSRPRRDDAPRAARPAATDTSGAAGRGGARHAARKELTRVERALDKLDRRTQELHETMAAAASDFAALRALNDDLTALTAQKAELEERWLELSEIAG